VFKFDQNQCSNYSEYAETSLKQAREKRDTARQQIADGIDPGENKKAVKQSRAESMANAQNQL